MFQPISGRDPRRKLVLYVEDEPANVLLMRAMFSRRPEYRLQIATDGASGLEAAHANQPGLLLLDINLPDCHGSELLRQLRMLPGCAHTPAIAVTADPMFSLSGTSFAEFWLKPLRLQYALGRLDRWLRESTSAPQAAGAAMPSRAS
ncbi:MAG TPA: response regulator, partial [Burkholderiaceae bacterium]